MYHQGNLTLNSVASGHICWMVMHVLDKSDHTMHCPVHYQQSFKYKWPEVSSIKSLPHLSKDSLVSHLAVGSSVPVPVAELYGNIVGCNNNSCGEHVHHFFYWTDLNEWLSMAHCHAIVCTLSCENHIFWLGSKPPLGWAQLHKSTDQIKSLLSSVKCDPLYADGFIQ